MNSVRNEKTNNSLETNFFEVRESDKLNGLDLEYEINKYDYQIKISYKGKSSFFFLKKEKLGFCISFFNLPGNHVEQSFYRTQIKDVFREKVLEGHDDTYLILKNFNRCLLDRSFYNSPVSMLCMNFNYENLILSYVNAGSNRPLIISPELAPKNIFIQGSPLGMYEKISIYKIAQVLKVGTKIIFISSNLVTIIIEHNILEYLINVLSNNSIQKAILIFFNHLKKVCNIENLDNYLFFGIEIPNENIRRHEDASS